MSKNPGGWIELEIIWADDEEDERGHEWQSPSFKSNRGWIESKRLSKRWLSGSFRHRLVSTRTTLRESSEFFEEKSAMPAKSQAQRRWAYGVKGPGWAKKHGFNNKGPLPKRATTKSKGKRKR